MKLNRIYTFLLAALTLAACSEDGPEWNVGNATVSMEQTEISARENAGIFNVPVRVDGERNGMVRVEVEVAETGSTPAMEDVHYYITSKSIVIPADATTGNIEIATVNDDEINETRTFTMTIKQVEGATVGAQASATISLRDEDSNFYEKLKGPWTMQGTDLDGATATWTGTITGMNENEEGYGSTLYFSGFCGRNDLLLTLQYSYDVASKTGSLNIVYGTSTGQLNFTGLGVCDVVAGTVRVGDKGYSLGIPEGVIPGTWNDEFTQITFDPDASLSGLVMRDGSLQGIFDGLLGNIVMTK